VKAASSINALAKTNSKRNGRRVLNFRMSFQGSKNYAPCNNSRRRDKTFFDIFPVDAEHCRSSRAGCASALVQSRRRPTGPWLQR
jgi:hypothetical protein